jgi:hypothetical protein
MLAEFDTADLVAAITDGEAGRPVWPGTLCAQTPQYQHP